MQLLAILAAQRRLRIQFDELFLQILTSVGDVAQKAAQELLRVVLEEALEHWVQLPSNSNAR